MAKAHPGRSTRHNDIEIVSRTSRDQTAAFGRAPGEVDVSSMLVTRVRSALEPVSVGAAIAEPVQRVTVAAAAENRVGKYEKYCTEWYIGAE